MVPDWPNPFQVLGEAAGKIVLDAWSTAMLGIWNAGLWLLAVVLRLLDGLLVPDLSETGPGRAAYRTTFWLAAALAVVMLLIQLGVTAVRRDGRSLATALWGCGKFVIVWFGWLGYGTVVVAAAGGLSRGLMRSLLGVTSWETWQPWQPIQLADVTDAAVATVLGILGLLLCLAAIGHVLVMIARGGALIVLTALTPVTAAGLLADAGRTWFWKSLRWFHAAAFTPVLMVLLLGVGAQFTTGVANGASSTAAQAVGGAIPGVLLLLIACFSPLALFKLLAFVDPNTPSGAAARAGIAAHGGIRGVLSGLTGGQDGGDTASGAGSTAASASVDGRSAGEGRAEQTTGDRFTHAEAGLLRTAAGSVVGGPAATALAGMQSSAGAATAVGTDLTNQMGVGHPGYHPDTPTPDHTDDAGDAGDAGGSGQGDVRPDTDNAAADPPTGGGAGPGLGSADDPDSPAGRVQAPYQPTLPDEPQPAATPPSGPPAPAAGGAGAGAGAGVVEGAAAIPVVPV